MKRWIFPSTYFRSTTSGQSIKMTDNKKKEGARKERRIDLTESANVVCTTSDPAGHCLQPTAYIDTYLSSLFALCLLQCHSPAGFAFPTNNFGCVLMRDIFLDLDLVQNCEFSSKR